MSVDILPAVGFLGQPCPDWCVEDCTPDPGVIDHYSREWKGGDSYDGASWMVQVTQRIQQGPDGQIIEGLAVIDVIGADGAYASTSGLVRALILAQQLADRINAARRRAA
ncbi:hypothetical protein ACIBCR_15440 [Micromonospora echinospora]|uniref:hypothetical protein n=1 Tax=Micromonospora echinospora TaxID=1877 RepID=UPI0037A19813